MVSWDTCMLSSSGYWVFSQPEICFGDQSSISLLATMSRNFRLLERRQRRAARPTARLRHRLDWLDTQDGRHGVRPPGSRSIPLALNVWQSHGTTMVLAKSAPDLMQRLPCFPTTPHIDLLLRGKPKPSPYSHKHLL